MWNEGFFFPWFWWFSVIYWLYPTSIRFIPPRVCVWERERDHPATDLMLTPDLASPSPPLSRWWGLTPPRASNVHTHGPEAPHENFLLFQQWVTFMSFPGKSHGQQSGPRLLLCLTLPPAHSDCCRLYFRSFMASSQEDEIRASTINNQA